MSRRNYIEDLEFEIANGMDSTTPLASMRPGYVRTAYNCNYGLVSGYIKRDGFTAVLSVAWGSLNISGGIEHKGIAGTTRTVVFGTDDSAAGGELSYIDSGATTVHSPSLLTSLTGTTRPSLINFQDLVFFYNGVDTPKVWDGTSVMRQVGITAPLAAPTGVAAATGGSLVASARYLGAYTYYNSVTGAESTPSPFQTITLGGADNRITWTLVAGSAVTADTIRVYITVANGSQLYLDGTAVISAVSYVSNKADSALGDPLELDNTRIATLTSSAKYPVVAGNRVFVVSDDNEIRYSKFSPRGPMPESFEVNAVVPTMGSRGNADKLVGQGSIGDLVIALKMGSVGRLEPIGFQDPTSFSDNQFYVYKEISNEVGGVSHWAGGQVEGEYIFLSRTNIYATDGDKLRTIADSIQSIIRTLGYSTTQSQKISFANDSKYKRIYITSFPAASPTKPTWILVGDYQTYPNFRWSVYRPGTNSTTHPGIKAASFIPVTRSDGSKDIYFGNIDLDGQIYRMNSGEIDNTKGIYFEVSSRPYNGQGRVNFLKLFKDGRIQAQGNGGSYSLTVSAAYDLSSAEEGSTALSLYNGGARWDDAEWDVDMWPGDDSRTVKYSVHRKAYFQQLVFRQTDASAPITLFGWSTSGSIYGPF